MLFLNLAILLVVAKCQVSVVDDTHGVAMIATNPVAGKPVTNNLTEIGMSQLSQKITQTLTLRFILGL